MGCYINPKNNGDKEYWLNSHGTKIVRENIDSFKDRPEGKLPVILLDNGLFHAAGVAFSQEEWEVFSNPSDSRPKKYFYVPISELKEVSPLKDYL